MLDLLISIFILNFFTICFKWYEKYNVHNFTAIIVNYLTAGTLGFLLSKNHDLIKFGSNFEISNEFKNILTYGSLIGGLFIIVFNLVAYSTQNIGIAKTVLVSKIASIALPVSFAILFSSDTVSDLKVFALILSIASLFFLFNFKNRTLPKIALIILLGIFIGQGTADILFDNSANLIAANHSAIYFAFIFSFAGIFGLIISLFLKKQRFKANAKNILFGMLLGVPNYFSLVFFFRALSKLDTAIVFPVMNIGVILLSILTGLIFFKEKLSLKNYIGIIIASISLYLIAL